MFGDAWLGEAWLQSHPSRASVLERILLERAYLLLEVSVTEEGPGLDIESAIPAAAQEGVRYRLCNAVDCLISESWPVLWQQVLVT